MEKQQLELISVLSLFAAKAAKAAKVMADMRLRTLWTAPRCLAAATTCELRKSLSPLVRCLVHHLPTSHFHGHDTLRLLTLNCIDFLCTICHAATFILRLHRTTLTSMSE